MNIELWKLSDVKPYPGNPRMNDSAVDAIAASIGEFGFRQPVVVDADGVTETESINFKKTRMSKSAIPETGRTDQSTRTLAPTLSNFNQELDDMLNEKQRNQIRANRIEELLPIYKQGQPRTIESVVRHYRDRYSEEGNVVEDLETLLSDLFSDLRHFARIRHPAKQAAAPCLEMVPILELEGFIKDLREFAEEHDLSWQTILGTSHMHFEEEVDDEILDLMETCGISRCRIAQ